MGCNGLLSTIQYLQFRVPQGSVLDMCTDRKFSAQPGPHNIPGQFRGPAQPGPRPASARPGPACSPTIMTQSNSNLSKSCTNLDWPV